MEDRNKLTIRNMGVVDIDGLNDRGEAIATSFTMAEVRARNPDWGRPEPRPTVEYPVSPHIELSKIAGILEDFSIGRQENRSKANLRDSVSEYVFRIESTKNLLCIHHRPSPEFYYDRTVLRIPGAFSSKYKNNCPRVLIVSDSEADAIRVEQALIKEQRRAGNQRARPGIHLLKADSPQETFNAGVMIGSLLSVFNFLEEARRNDRMTDVKEFLKFIVINNAEKLSIIPMLNDLLDKLADVFEDSWTRFIFMYHFAAAQAAPILNVVQKCHEKLLHGMFIEVETPRMRNLFERVEFSLVVPSTEFADRRAAQEISQGRSLSERDGGIFRKVFTPQAQKVIICAQKIQKLRNDRENRNRNLDEFKKRRERILIITETSEVAIMVMMSLKRKSETCEPRNKYSVNCLLTQDSIDNKELRNCEFRDGKLDVLVINWESIDAVNRGTVDSVILFDSPPTLFFQTMMETQMEKLTSKICVRLKLFILLDQQVDQVLLPEYVKFLLKHKKRAPQWFQTLYEKYRADYNARLEESEIEDTLTAGVQSDNTLLDDTLR